MKKMIFGGCAALSLMLASPVHAGQQQAWGTGVGAAVGTAVAGPLGMVAGGIVGSFIGWNESRREEHRHLETALAESRYQLAQATAAKPTGSHLQVASAADTRLPALEAMAGDLENALISAYASAVYFDTGSDRLTAHFKAQLERIATLTEHFPGLVVQLDGHADPRGADGDNLSLSGRRVASVRRVLIDSGVPAGRILTASHGERETLSSPGEAAAFPYDRRVSISFVSVTRGSMPVANDTTVEADLAAMTAQ